MNKNIKTPRKLNNIRIITTILLLLLLSAAIVFAAKEAVKIVEQKQAENKRNEEVRKVYEKE